MWSKRTGSPLGCQLGRPVGRSDRFQILERDLICVIVQGLINNSLCDGRFVAVLSQAKPSSAPFCVSLVVVDFFRAARSPSKYMQNRRLALLLRI